MDSLEDLSLVLEIKPNVTAADKALKDLTRGLEDVDKSSKKLSGGLGTSINSLLSDLGIRLPAAFTKIINLLDVFGKKTPATEKDEELGGGTAHVGGTVDVFKGGGRQGWNQGGIDVNKMMGGGEESAGGADMMVASEGGGLAAALGPIALAAGAAVVGLKMLAGASQKIVQLAGINNPAVAERFQRSLLDAEAVIGNRLIPVVEVMTKGMQLVGDVLQTILPSEADIRDAMRELDPVLNQLRDAAAELAPMLKQQFRDSLQVAIIGLQLFADQISVATFMLGPLAGGKGKGLESARGMAASQASTVGIEDISKRAIEAAYGQGAGGPQDRTASSAEKILKLLEDNLGRHDAAHQSKAEKAESYVLGAPAQFFRWLAEFGR